MSTPSDQIPPYEPVPPVVGAIAPEERTWAMFAHLSALGGMLLTGAWFGWGCFVGPLIIWLLKKDTMPFVNDQGKESLNFNITVAIVLFVFFVLSILTFGLGFVIFIPLGFVVGVVWLVFTIIATIKANEGVAYRYPFCLRLIK
jgi:uncharacterized Tic20 family protein